MKNKDISLKKLPPHSIDAEKSILGAVLLDNDSINKAIQVITYQDFYETKHQKIFKAMTEMSGEGEGIDLVTLSENLLQSGDLEIIGGPPYLMDLMEATPTATTIIHHSKIVKNKATLRRLIAIGTQLNLESYGERVDAENILNRTEELIYDLREGMGGEQDKIVKLGDALPPFFEEIKAICGESDDNLEPSYIIPTGYIDLDEMIVGVSESQMIVLAGRPSMGKTALALGVMLNITSRGIPSALFSIETSGNKCVERLVCTESKVDSQHLRSGKVSQNEWKRLFGTMKPFSNLPLYIYDCPKLTLSDFRFKVKTLVREFGIKLVGVDYLQLMGVKGNNRGSRAEEVSTISRGVKSVLREFGVAGIIISQLSREVEKRKPPRPILSDLKESGSIEQDADMVWMLYRHAYYDKMIDTHGYGGEDRTTELIINKHRNGKTGTIKLAFQKEFTRFENISRDAEGGF
jgi:replicative DNA helicase